MYEAVDGAATRAAGSESDGAASKAKAAVPDEVAAELGAALLFLSEGVRWGEGPQLAPTAVRMLPSLLRLQVRTAAGAGAGRCIPVSSTGEQVPLSLAAERRQHVPAGMLPEHCMVVSDMIVAP